MRTLNDAASLIDIQADGTTLPNFKPYQYSYVLPVTTTPAITYTAFTGAQVSGGTLTVALPPKSVVVLELQ